MASTRPGRNRFSPPEAVALLKGFPGLRDEVTAGLQHVVSVDQLIRRARRRKAPEKRSAEVAVDSSKA